MNVTIQATVSATSIRPLAVAQATGSVRPAGGISVSLTGTFDDASRDVSVSGGGYTFSGRVGTGGVLAGIYTGPNGLGGAFSSLDSTNSTVTAYCGSAVEERDGTIPFTIQVSSSGTLSGMIFGDPACALTGRATGNTLSVTDCEGRMNTGTIQGGTVSGRTPSGASFSGSTSACQ